MRCALGLLLCTCICTYLCIIYYVCTDFVVYAYTKLCPLSAPLVKIYEAHVLIALLLPLSMLLESYVKGAVIRSMIRGGPV